MDKYTLYLKPLTGPHLQQACNQLVTSLLTTCNRLVVNKLSQAIRTHPDIGLLITSLLQAVNNLVQSKLDIRLEQSLYKLFEGDVKLREDDLDERHEVKRNALRDRNKLWLTRIIPYEISDDLSEYVKC